MTRSELNSVVTSLIRRTDKSDLINSALTLAIKEIGKLLNFREAKNEEDLSIRSVALNFSDGAWTSSTKTLVASGAFADYAFVAGDQIYVAGGTGATIGWDTVASRNDDDTIVLSTSFGVDATDVAATAIGQPYKLSLGGLSQVPTHILEARIIDGTQSFTFGIFTKDHVVAIWPNVSAETPSYPVMGYVEGGYIWMHPISNADYTMRLTFTSLSALAFSGDSTENPIPHTDYAVICWATGFVLDSIDLTDRALIWKARYIGAVQSDLHVDRSFPETMVAETGLEFDIDPLTGRKIISPTAYLHPFDKGR